MNLSNNFKGHASMLGAEILWGVAAPVGKAILLSGITSMVLTDCRFVGAAILFWVASLFFPREHVERRDLLRMFIASLLCIVINQCCFLWGLGLTSPINATVITTALPILTMLLAAVVLREPITGLKIGGVVIGATGALILIFGNRADSSGGGSVLGDILVFTAQAAFTCYLVFFKGLIAKYSAITLMKWMFTFATVVTIPFTIGCWIDTNWTEITFTAIAGCIFFAVGPTFLSYLLLPIGQKHLRPTLTAMYNYVQPIVATIIALIAGMGRFTIWNVTAIILVFVGVFMVTKSRKRVS